MLAGLLCLPFALAAHAELPVPCAGGTCGTNPAANVPFAQAGTASYATQGNVGYVNQVGAKAIVNFRSYNLSPGSRMVYQQVDGLGSNNPVAGAEFTNLSRIWDANPSVIAGAITQAAGQKANVILVNTNGIAFMNGAQVDLNTFTASSLGIKDSYILQSLFPGDGLPQFEGETGFVKVMEGARISAGNYGRVMLIAPTVVNKGTVSAPDGQVIAAAASKVYLRAAGSEDTNVRGLLVEIDSPAALNDFDTSNTSVKNGQLDGTAVALTDASEDKLGHATNLGVLSTPRGNVTMVGYAVNQLGVARATTSVVSNGSIYLLAKDRASNNGVFDSVGARRGGRVLLGENSRTEVLFDLRAPKLDEAKLAGALAAGILSAGEVDALRAEAAAVVDGVAPSSRIDAYLVGPTPSAQTGAGSAQRELTSSEIRAYLAGDKGPGDLIAGTDGLRYHDYFDATGAVDGAAKEGLEKASQVNVLGQDIRVAGGAAIVAPSGNVSLVAVDAPGTLNSSTSLYTGNSPVSDAARIHVAADARIDVAGLEDVRVAVERNSVEVELRGDELKDSPINRTGPLRGQTAYVDINRALARAKGGQSTLIAQDSLEAYQARTERTVAERATRGGTVSAYSQGETIVEAGSTIDLSGGSLKYTEGLVNTTLLYSGAGLVDLADAKADVRYDGIATRYVRDYGRWNVQETINLGQSVRYDPGYSEGKDAGAMAVFGMKATYLQANLVGDTTIGELQRETGTQPLGARLVVGFDDPSKRNVVDNLSRRTIDYKLNQDVDLVAAAALLPAGFKFGDDLPDELRATLSLDTRQVGQGKVARLEVLSNRTVNVRDALSMPQGGTVTLAGSGILVAADIDAPSGAIDLLARDTLATVPVTLNGGEKLPDPLLEIAAGVTLSARGAWVNELPGMAGSGELAMIDGGSISLRADTRATNGAFDAQGRILLGEGVSLDASGGARILSSGTRKYGDGGELTLSAYDIQGLVDNVSAYGFAEGGSLSLASGSIAIGGAENGTFGRLVLDTDFFQRGGFADFTLTAYEDMELAAGAVLRPRVANLELDNDATLFATGGDPAGFSHLVTLDDSLRQRVDLTLVASLSEAGTGDLLLDTGSGIELDPGAHLILQARNSLVMQGAVVAKGGTISATLDRSGGYLAGAANVNPIWLGAGAVLDVSGTALTYLDGKGLIQGEVLAGGRVDLNAKTGYVVTEAGSRIDVSGAPSTYLDVENEAGGLGSEFASDAGTLTIYAEQGIVLDGDLVARAGSANRVGGVFDVTLSTYVEPPLGSPGQPDILLSLAATVAPQALGLAPDSALPMESVVRARLGADKLDAAGFDRILLASRDGIRLENGLAIGAGRAVPLRELRLDAARIQSDGGNASLVAETLRLGNYDPARKGGAAAETASGVLSLSGAQIELAGNLRLEGMGTVALAADEAIWLAGVTSGSERPAGSLASTADLALSAPLVAPSTFSAYTLSAPGRKITFAGVGELPRQPLSAQGELVVEAATIEQNGRIWAPMGAISLKASGDLSLGEDSVTSVAADADSLIPFGKVLNGRAWIYEVDSTNEAEGQIQLSSLAGKTIRLDGQTLKVSKNARVDVSGGGDLQAYEFTVGPGGSRDILAEADTYAILPGYAGGIAPIDAQESQGFGLAAGTSVYLSGVPGLPEGRYVLLPAHYALLPGAYAVKLGQEATLFPSQSHTRLDGVRIAAGYLTDSRSAAPESGDWRAIQVLTRAQVMERSEFTLTRASTYFGDSSAQVADAGLLAMAVSRTGLTATGESVLNIDPDAVIDLSASNGRAGALDISAPRLEIVGTATQAGGDPEAVHLSAEVLNGWNPASLFLGGTRYAGDGTTTLAVLADFLTISNDAEHPLRAAEILLAARDTLRLDPDSVLEAQGDAGSASSYTTAGDGALVRAATDFAEFTRTGSPVGNSGRLVADAYVDAEGVRHEARITAYGAILLDATRENAFKGDLRFQDAAGRATAGHLALGGERIGFGDPANAPGGLLFSQDDLDAFSGLASLTLSSYSGFDLYGEVAVGGLDANGDPTLKSLTLQGAGLAGVDNAGGTAVLRARELRLANPSGAAFVPGPGTPGTGELEIHANTLTLGEGDKAIRGFTKVSVTADELVGADSGATTIGANTHMDIGQLRGLAGSNQSLVAEGTLTVAGTQSARQASAIEDLGASWTLKGTQVTFDTLATLPSGRLALVASAGDLTLGAHAGIDVAGRHVKFFDVLQAAPGGSVSLTSETGSVLIQSDDVNHVHAKVDVSAAAGGDAGGLTVNAVHGRLELQTGVELLGLAPADAVDRGEGARFALDVAELDDFAAVNEALNEGGFDGARQFRVRASTQLTVSGEVKAKTISIALDAGELIVSGHLDASGADAGSIGLYAAGDLTLDGAALDAYASGSGENGGLVELESVAGLLDLSGGSVNAAAGSGGIGGKVMAIAAQTGSVAAFANPLADTGSATAFKVAAPDGVTILAEGQVIVFKAGHANTSTAPTLQIGTLAAKAIRKNGGDNLSAGDIKVGDTVAVMYDGTNFQLVSAGVGSGVNAKTFAEDHIVGASQAALYGRKTYQASSIDAKLQNQIEADASVFAEIANSLASGGMRIRPAAEIVSPAGGAGDITLATDWNLSYANRGDVRAGLLTIRARGNLKVNNNLSDGFSLATACTTTPCPASNPTPATLRTGDSWTYRLVAGADTVAADPMAVKAGDGDVTLAAGKLVRTGTGDIRIASGDDIILADAKSAIYTAGRVADAVAGFANPFSNLRATFSQQGGNVTLNALGDISGKPSTQLYSEWLYRQGALDQTTGSYTRQTAWWVRFDQFQQGVGALGGGDVTLIAGGDVKDVSASTPTQARMGASSPDASRLVVTGGGDVRVEAGGSVLGGQYYADRGTLSIRAGGDIGAGDQKIGSAQPLATLVALGDAQAELLAWGDVTLSNLLNPHLLVQSSGNLAVGIGQPTPGRSLFSTYSDATSAALASVTGNTRLLESSSALTTAYAGLLNSTEGKRDGQLDLAFLLPATLAATAFQGDVEIGTNTRNLTMAPSSQGNLTLLAADTVRLESVLSMSDRDPVQVPTAVAPVMVDSSSAQGTLLIPALLVNPARPTSLDHADTPIHTGDDVPARIYARDGDVLGFFDSDVKNKHLIGGLDLSKAALVRAGRDVGDLFLQVQHADADNVSVVEAGRDIYLSGVVRRDEIRLRVGGLGRLEVTAGRNIDLGTSAGIVSRGNLDNPNLPAGGADLQLAAGVGAGGVDYAGTVTRLVRQLGANPADDSTLWLARWLTGDDTLDAAHALAAVAALEKSTSSVQRERVRTMLFTALRATGRDSTNAASPYAGDYARGYAAMELVFPGIGETDDHGGFTRYSGDINLFASRVKTERGGSIEFLLPGGQLAVGLTNTPAALVNVGDNVLGIVVAGEGNIFAATRDDILVNQSRILTVGGGDVLLWSSEGDIDAGKGKKTASAVPPPVITVDSQGNITQELQGAVTGSGIGALEGLPGVEAGDVDLIAPKGTVNAGDAGIRAGNLNIAAQVVLNAENIQVSGVSSGVPVADTASLSAGLAGNSSLGDTQAVAETTRSVGGQAGDEKKVADEVKQTLASFRPSFISVEVMGFGEETASTGEPAGDGDRRRRQGG